MKRAVNQVDVGRRIAARRRERGYSQATVARRSGIDPSYLSRIETGRVQPSVRMALRIATALRMSLDDVLGPSPAEKKGQPCPVSLNGRCLLDLIDATTGEADGHGPERYSARQLRMLRRFSALLQRGSPTLLRALDAMMVEMLDSAPRGRSST